LASIYLDTGITEVFNLLLPLIDERIREIKTSDFIIDYKTELQYLIQKKHKICPEYHVINEEGPAHNRIFYSELLINNKKIATGKGSSKKKSEQEAAKVALLLLHNKELEI
jgi:ribonuclease-3